MKFKLFLCLSAFTVLCFAAYTLTLSFTNSGLLTSQFEVLANGETGDEGETGGDGGETGDGSETGGGFRYPDKSGNCKTCTFNKYTNIKTKVTITSESSIPELDMSAEWIKSSQPGLYDTCPKKGKGCNPYSCQFVPYN